MITPPAATNSLGSASSSGTTAPIVCSPVVHRGWGETDITRDLVFANDEEWSTLKPTKKRTLSALVEREEVIIWHQYVMPRKLVQKKPKNIVKQEPKKTPSQKKPVRRQKPARRQLRK